MHEAIKSIVDRTTLATAVVGAVLSPIPLVDELVLFPIYLRMAARIARAHQLDKVPWRPIGMTTLNGLLARAAANLAVSYLPGVAAAANAASAALLSGLLGKYFDDTCADPAAARSIGPRAIIAMLREQMGGGALAPKAS